MGGEAGTGRLLGSYTVINDVTDERVNPVIGDYAVALFARTLKGQSRDSLADDYWPDLVLFLQDDEQGFRIEGLIVTMGDVPEVRAIATYLFNIWAQFDSLEALLEQLDEHFAPHRKGVWNIPPGRPF